MRLKLFLRQTDGNYVPINYQFFLQSLIYDTLRESSVDYSSFLHDEGYRHGGKQFKMFTYSMLDTGRVRRVGRLLDLKRKTVSWMITSPVEDFVQHFVRGLFDKGEFMIDRATFRLERVETLPEPEFTGEMRFIALSPVTMSTVKIEDGKKMTHYYRPDEDISEPIKKNLQIKYGIISGETPPEDDLTFRWDEDYIERRKGRISKLINFKNVYIKSYLCPFTVKGPPELIKAGYDCGFGDKNSAGFGMAKTMNPSNELRTGGE